MTRKRLLLVLLGLALLAALGLALRPGALEVELAPVQSGPLQVTVDDQGETRSQERFVVSAPVAGRLTRIALRDGDAVSENQLLAEIAPLPQSQRERDEVQARVAFAAALQREAEQRVRQAEAGLAQAQREHERLRRLVQQDFVAPQGVEQARLAELTATGELEAARFRSRAAAAELKLARAGLGATGPGGRVPVRAPLAGHVLRIPDPSERVVAAGTPLLTLGDLGRLEIVIDLLSSEAVRVTPGMPVRVEGWGGERMLRARVRRVEPFAFTKVSALGVEEKRVNVIADFIDPPGPLGDGFRLNARIVVWQADAVLKLPTSALFRCAAAWCVFALENGRARQRAVEIGQRNLLEAELLRGLSAGAAVIRYPGNELRDGSRVRARPD